jgi:hypothetical protein
MPDGVISRHAPAREMLALSWGLEIRAYLYITSAPVEVQVQIFDLTKVGEFVLQVLLAGFLVHVCHYDDPAFDGPDSGCVGLGLH